MVERHVVVIVVVVVVVVVVFVVALLVVVGVLGGVGFAKSFSCPTQPLC